MFSFACTWFYVLPIFTRAWAAVPHGKALLKCVAAVLLEPTHLVPVSSAVFWVWGPQFRLKLVISMAFTASSARNVKAFLGIRAGLVQVSWEIWVQAVCSRPVFRLSSCFQKDLRASERSEFNVELSACWNLEVTTVPCHPLHFPVVGNSRTWILTFRGWRWGHALMVSLCCPWYMGFWVGQVLHDY